MAMPRPRTNNQPCEIKLTPTSLCDNPTQLTLENVKYSPTDFAFDSINDVKRKAGRPKGSKNKKHVPVEREGLDPPNKNLYESPVVLKRLPKRMKMKKAQAVDSHPEPSPIDTLLAFITHLKEEPRRLSREEMVRVGTYIFDQLVSHAFARPFVNPVAFDAYYYRSRITELMDLDTAEKKLWAGKYRKVSDLYADLVQIMVNAVTFHREGDLIYEEARLMCECFTRRLYPLVNECLFDEEPSLNIPPMPLPHEEFEETCFNPSNTMISDVYLMPIATVRENKKVLTGNAMERLEIFCRPLIEIFTDREIPPVELGLSARSRNFARLYCTGGRDMLEGCIDDPYAVAVIVSDIQYSKTTETMNCKVLVVKPFGPQHDLSTVDFPEINDARCWVRCAIISRLKDVSIKLSWNYFGKTLPYSFFKLEEDTVSPQFFHDLMDLLKLKYQSSSPKLRPQKRRLLQTPNDSCRESDDSVRKAIGDESEFQSDEHVETLQNVGAKNENAKINDDSIPKVVLKSTKRPKSKRPQLPPKRSLRPSTLRQKKKPPNRITKQPRRYQPPRQTKLKTIVEVPPPRQTKLKTIVEVPPLRQTKLKTNVETPPRQTKPKTNVEIPPVQSRITTSTKSTTQSRRQTRSKVAATPQKIKNQVNQKSPPSRKRKTRAYDSDQSMEQTGAEPAYEIFNCQLSVLPIDTDIDPGTPNGSIPRRTNEKMVDDFNEDNHTTQNEPPNDRSIPKADENRSFWQNLRCFFGWN